MKNIIEDTQFEEISRSLFDDTMDMRTDKHAQLVGVNLIDNTRVCSLISSHGDIYQLLGSSANSPEKFEGYDLVAILTAGWAAPVGEDDDIAPSQHKNRKRVKIVLIGNTSEQTSSVMGFDGEDEIIYSKDEGRGSLQDAFEEMLKGIGW